MKKDYTTFGTSSADPQLVNRTAANHQQHTHRHRSRRGVRLLEKSTSPGVQLQALSRRPARSFLSNDADPRVGSGQRSIAATNASSMVTTAPFVCCQSHPVERCNLLLDYCSANARRILVGAEAQEAESNAKSHSRVVQHLSRYWLKLNPSSLQYYRLHLI